MDRFDSDMPFADDTLEQRLRSERPELSALQLDAVKGNVRRRMQGRGSTIPGRSLMKSRLALTVILVLGLMMTGTGATIAITGASDSGSAGVAQYGNSNGNGNEGGNLAGEEQGGGGGGGGGNNTQPAEQVAAQGTSGSLPFTGFVAIPLLVGGAALAGTGAFMRRRTHE
jgi:hypothetical protein